MRAESINRRLKKIESHLTRKGDITFIRRFGYDKEGNIILLSEEKATPMQGIESIEIFPYKTKRADREKAIRDFYDRV